MKTTTTTSVVGSMGGETHAMTFDTQGTAHLMSILSNMYRNKALAVVREYSTNALDSHVEAGNLAPIQVTLPSEWEHNFIVKDFGVGLSKDEIVQVYASYGKSTKRDTNTQVGAFGIGAKSAFTIGAQFTVIGVKNGKKNIAVFSLNAQGAGEVTIINNNGKGDEPTDEPNGVTVSIAVEDKAAVRDAANNMFSTWAPGTVLVNGVEPQLVWDSKIRVTDDIYASKNQYYGKMVVVMGGIGYPVTANMVSKSERMVKNKIIWNKIRQGNLDLIVRVPTGSVDITPSREDLRDTPRTVQAVADAINDYAANIEKTIAEEINKADSAVGAIVNAQEYKDFIDLSNGITWNGKKIDYRLDLPYTMVFKSTGRNGVKCGSINNTPKITIANDLSKVLVITGALKKTPEAIRRMASRLLCKQNQYDYWILAPGTKGKFDWFSFGDNDTIATKSLDDLVKEYKAGAPAAAKAGEVTYYTIGADQNWSTAEQIADMVEDVYWFKPEDLKNAPQDLVTECFKDAVRINLTHRHKMELFHKRVPSATSGKEYFDKWVKAEYAKITSEELEILRFTALDKMELVAMIAESLGDINYFGTEPSEYRKIVDKIKNVSLDYRRLRALASAAGEPIESDDSKYVKFIKDFEKKFPLAMRVNSSYTYGKNLNGSGNRYYYKYDQSEAVHAGLYVQAVLASTKSAI